MIIQKYLRSTLVRSTGAITAVLLLIALSNKFVSLIGHAASGDLPGTLLFQMVALHVPELLAFLLPLGFFLGIVLSTGTLYAENQMVALFANGVSWRLILIEILKISLVITGIVGLLTLWSIPKFHLFKEQLLNQHESAHLIQTMSPGRFHSLKNGTVVFYVEEMTRGTDSLQEVFIAEQPLDSSEAWSVLTAERGVIHKSEQGHRYLELSNGTRYEGKPGSSDYSVVSYDTYGRLVEEPQKQVPMFNRVTPTAMLLKSTAPHHRAELQWRIAIPLSTTILGLMAIGICYIAPRSGRYAKVLPGILTYIVYYNLLTVSKRWLEADVLSPYVGLWWVHSLALLVAAILMLSHSGKLSQWQYARRQSRIKGQYEAH
jgi:lipopolysaccharide export system permease protein